MKINLHELARMFDPKAAVPTPGSADICLIVDENVHELKQYLETKGVNILEGPVEKVGSNGPILSIYLRDPDNNLVELSNYL